MGRTFMDEWCDGRLGLVSLDDWVSNWHEGRSTDPDFEHIELHELLGLTQEQYAAWVKEPSSIWRARAQRNHKEALKCVEMLRQQLDSSETVLGEVIKARDEIVADRDRLRAENQKLKEDLGR